MEAQHEEHVCRAGAASSEAGPDPIVQYVILRRDLWREENWPLGAVMAQGCHASLAAAWIARDEPDTQTYLAPENLDSMHKVVLECKSEAQLRTLSDKLTSDGVTHKLWVEQPENCASALATAPARKSTLAAYFKKMQLCKAACVDAKTMKAFA